MDFVVAEDAPGALRFLAISEDGLFDLFEQRWVEDDEAAALYALHEGCTEPAAVNPYGLAEGLGAYLDAHTEPQRLRANPKYAEFPAGTPAPPSDNPAYHRLPHSTRRHSRTLWEEFLHHEAAIRKALRAGYVPPRARREGEEALAKFLSGTPHPLTEWAAAWVPGDVFSDHVASVIKMTPKVRERRWKEIQASTEALAAVDRRARGMGYTRSRADMERHRSLLSRRSVYFTMVFAALTARQETDIAERNMREVAPHLLDRLRRGLRPEVPEAALASWFGGLSARFSGDFFGRLWDDVPQVMALLDRYQDVELRRKLAFRERGLPAGLGLIKGSFLLELLGQNVACLDRWILRFVLGAYDPARSRRARLAAFESTDRVMDELQTPAEKSAPFRAVRRYEVLEQGIRSSPFYDPADPMGLARAQWLTWEVLVGRRTTHEPLFEVTRGEEVEGFEGFDLDEAEAKALHLSVEQRERAARKRARAAGRKRA